MKLHHLVLFAGCAVCVTANSRAATILFTGTGDPQDQGWTLYSGGTGTASVVTQNTGSPGDVLTVETTAQKIYEYSYSTGYKEFLLGARIFVESASYNYLDAGLMLSAFGGVGFLAADRFNSLYLTPGAVGFMDLAASAPVPAGQFHDYSILVRDGNVSVYVDQTFSSILDGTATAVLTRAAPAQVDGEITLGDQTNDPGVNSRYRLDEVTFQGITIVPDPATGVMFVVGPAVLFGGKRARTQIKKARA